MTRLEKAMKLRPDLTEEEILETCVFETLNLPKNAMAYCSEDNSDCCGSCWKKRYKEGEMK